MYLVAEFPWWVRSAIRKLGQTSTILVVIVLLVLTVLTGAALVTILEVAAGSKGPQNFMDALWWYIVTITGLGLDAVAPDAPASRATSAIVLLLARIFFGMFTAAIASALINRLLMEGKGMGEVVLRNHAVICGWNSRGEKIVEQLVKDERAQDIVILAGLENAPVRRHGVHFIHGDATTDADLRRASVLQSETVLILADESTPGLSDTTMDARSVLVALAVEKLNPVVYTCAEVRRSSNRDHFVRAGVDEIVFTCDIGAELLARTSVHHGISGVINDLLTSDAGNEIYVMACPPSLVGKAFAGALALLQGDQRALLLGLMRGSETMLNPVGPVALEQGDKLILISRDRVQMA